MSELPTSSVQERLIRPTLILFAVVLAFTLGSLWRWSGPPAAGEVVAGPAGEETWTCAMHPEVRATEPGACPICGMDLVAASSAATDATSVDRVTLGPRAATLARLRTEPVARAERPATQLRLLGRVEVDESRRRHVTSWIAGRIDRLHVTETGKPVRRGQTVATLYSPEVYTAHQDLLAATRQVGRLANGSILGKEAADSAVRAARTRLALLGIPEEEIDQLAGATKPTRKVAIRSPFAGTVIERVATMGSYVDTGAVLYEVADLSSVWIQLEAYERDLPFLAEGQSVTLEVDGLADVALEGEIDFIEPRVDPMRRVVKVRVEVANEDGLLKPGMYATAVVDSEAATHPVVVPFSAPLFTGRRSLVYVEVPDQHEPTYEARVVRLGPRVGRVYPVLAGLSEGERVVTEGAFVLDADLQIRGGHGMLARSDDRDEAPLDAVVVGAEELRAALGPVLEAYLELQRGLADDDRERALGGAKVLLEQLDEVEEPDGREAREVWSRIGPHLRHHAVEVAQAETLADQRAPFELVSRQIEALLSAFGNPLDRPLRVAFCPMAFDGRGARWVQDAATVDNAYFGHAMRRCGSIEASVDAGQHLIAKPAAPEAHDGGRAH